MPELLPILNFAPSFYTSNDNVMCLTLDKLKQSIKSNPIGFEVVYADTYVKPYFDCDIKGDVNEINVNDYVKKVKYFISTQFNCKESDILVSKAHRDNKISYHFVVKGIKTQVSSLVNWKYNNIDAIKELNIDPSVYRNGMSKFRCVNTYKQKKDGKREGYLEIEGDDSIEDHLIQVTNEDDVIFTCDRITKSKVKKENEKKMSKKEMEIKEKYDSDKTSVALEVLQNISKKRFESYEDWLKILMICKLCGLTFDQFNGITNTRGYNDDDNLNVWNGANPNGELTIGTLIYYLKIDNPKKYTELFCNISKAFMDKTDECVCVYDIDLVKLCIFALEEKGMKIAITGKGEVWIFEETWTEISINLLAKKIANILLPMLKAYVKKIYDENPDGISLDDAKLMKKHDMLHTIISKISNNSTFNSILDYIIKDSYIDNFVEKLDSNPNMLACANGVWDFKNNEFRKQRWDDYISKNTNCNWIELEDRNPNDIELIKNVLQQILPKRPILDYVLKCIASICYGENPDQKFHCWTGTGSNGKTFLQTLLIMIFGSYIIMGDTRIIDENLPYPDGEILMALRGARGVFFTEIEKGHKLRSAIYKKLSGEDIMTARGLYKAVVAFRCLAKLFYCTQYPLQSDSNDQGIVRRACTTPFDSVFKTNPDESKGEFKKDPFLLSKINKDTFLSFMIDLHREYMKLDDEDKKQWFNPPEEIVNYTKKVLEDHDPILNFLDNNYELGESKIPITAENIWMQFKKDKLRSNLPNIQRKELLEYVERHFNIEKLAEKQVDNKRYKSVYIGLTKIISSEYVDVNECQIEG